MTEKEVKQNFLSFWLLLSISGEDFIYRDEKYYDYKAEKELLLKMDRWVLRFWNETFTHPAAVAQNIPIKTNLFFCYFQRNDL